MPKADRDVIQGFVDGDRACLEQIDVWIAEVLRHPTFRLGDDVADVAQQVRRKLLTSLRSGLFQGASTLRTYVWRAAQHTAIDHIRRSRLHRPPASLDDVAEPADPATSPERALLQQERRDLFMRVLQRLGDECRELLQMIAFDESSYADIAIRLNTTEGAVKVRALRCREKAVAEYRSVTSGPGGRPFSKSAV